MAERKTGMPLNAIQLINRYFAHKQRPQPNCRKSTHEKLNVDSKLHTIEPNFNLLIATTLELAVQVIIKREGT